MPELLGFPYTFTQRDVLRPHKFAEAARARGIHTTTAHLESLHRLRVLVPLLRIRRDTRAIDRLAATQPRVAEHVSAYDLTSRVDLAIAHKGGRLFAARGERFLSQARRTRPVARTTYCTSEYLYSPYQLLALATAAPLLPLLRHDSRTDRVRIDARRDALRAIRDEVEALDGVIIALTALEPVHYPRVIERRRTGGIREHLDYDDWRDDLDASTIPTWLGVDAEWLRHNAAMLLREADRIDPLGGWLRVVREADPARWDELKGDARLAIDHRIAAEILLRGYDDLVDADAATPLPSAGRVQRDFDGRLKRQGGLDATLTDFGLSPHPRVLLVVEGPTELELFPRLMDHFGIRRDEDYIAIQTTEGVGASIGTLVAFAAGPRGQTDEHGRYLTPERPLTRILEIADAENNLATEALRAQRRRKLIERLVRTLPKDQRTAGAEQAMSHLVHVETWDATGQSFEFANFTDEEIARAVVAVDDRDRAPKVAACTRNVARVRASRGNLDSVLGGRSKVALADDLWPILMAKVEHAAAEGTEDQSRSFASSTARSHSRRNGRAAAWPSHSPSVDRGPGALTAATPSQRRPSEAPD